MNNRTLQQVIEEKGKLLNEMEVLLKDEKSFNEVKADQISNELKRKETEIEMIKSEQGKQFASMYGDKAPELRIHGTREKLESGRPGDLEQWVSDVVKSAFGMSGVHTRTDILGGSTSGAYLVPAPLSNQLISYVTERSLLGRLGVTNIAVDTDTTTYGQVSALPTADVISEGSELTESDPTFVARTLQTYSYRAGTIVSQEFSEDSIAHPQNILEPIAQAIAQNIDSDFINGTAPVGLASMTGTYTRYHMGVNGSALTDYAELLTLWQKARELNIDVTAYVMSPRTRKGFAALVTGSELNPLGQPDLISSIPMIESNQVLNTETQGTATSICTKVYAGDFKRGVWAGWRYGSAGAMKFIVDASTLANYGKIRIYGYCRMGLAYPYGYGKFGWIQGILDAAGSIT